jgi:hypothetical protein
MAIKQTNPRNTELHQRKTKTKARKQAREPRRRTFTPLALQHCFPNQPASPPYSLNDLNPCFIHPPFRTHSVLAGHHPVPPLSTPPTRRPRTPLALLPLPAAPRGSPLLPCRGGSIPHLRLRLNWRRRSWAATPPPPTGRPDSRVLGKSPPPIQHCRRPFPTQFDHHSTPPGHPAPSFPRPTQGSPSCRRSD